MDFNNEKEVAKRSEQMLTRSLNQKTSGFASHVRNSEKDKSLKDAFAVAKVKTYRSTVGEGKIYMTSLAIKMTRHGFIQHYGADIQRSSGSRTRKKPKTTTYNFASHYFKMQAKPFINAAISQSGVIPFVMENITKLRSERFLLDVRRILENR